MIHSVIVWNYLVKIQFDTSKSSVDSIVVCIFHRLLSKNLIGRIDRNTFLHLNNLKKLNLNYNAIDRLPFGTFTGLMSLTKLLVICTNTSLLTISRSIELFRIWLSIIVQELFVVIFVHFFLLQSNPSVTMTHRCYIR